MSELTQLVTSQGLKYAYIYPGAQLSLSSNEVILKSSKPHYGAVRAEIYNPLDGVENSRRVIYLYTHTFDSRSKIIKYAYLRDGYRYSVVNDLHIPSEYSGTATFLSEPSQSILSAYRLFDFEVFENFMDFYSSYPVINPESKLDRFLCRRSDNKEYLNNIINVNYKSNNTLKCDKCKRSSSPAKFHSCSTFGRSFCSVALAILLNAERVIYKEDCVILVSPIDHSFPSIVIVKPESIGINGVYDEMCYAPISRLLVWRMLTCLAYTNSDVLKVYIDRLYRDLRENEFIPSTCICSIEGLIKCYDIERCIECAQPWGYPTYLCRCDGQYEHDVHLMLMGILKNGWSGDCYKGRAEVPIKGTLKLYDGDRVSFNNATHSGNIVWMIREFVEKMKSVIQRNDGDDIS